MNIDRNKLTPMMKQYFEVKDRYPDCILFFRLGDFYEMFFEDAPIPKEDPSFKAILPLFIKAFFKSSLSTLRLLKSTHNK